MRASPTQLEQLLYKAILSSNLCGQHPSKFGLLSTRYLTPNLLTGRWDRHWPKHTVTSPPFPAPYLGAVSLPRLVFLLLPSPSLGHFLCFALYQQHSTNLLRYLSFSPSHPTIFPCIDQHGAPPSDQGWILMSDCRCVSQSPGDTSSVSEAVLQREV